MGIYAVLQALLFDDNITHPLKSYVHYQNNDEVHIAVQQQNVFTLPSKSFLYIDGKLTMKSGSTGELNWNW